MIIAHAGHLKPSQLTSSVVSDIASSWAGLKPGTRIGYHAGLRHWLLYLGASWQCQQGIPHVVSPEAPTRVVPDTEFEAAFAAADPAIALCLLLCREAGLRAATAYGLTRQHIDDGCICTTTKNDGAVVVPMTERLAALVGAAMARSGPTQPLVIALGVPDGADIGNTLRHRLATLQKRIGVGDWTWHDLRRTAAQRLYAKTGDLRVVQSLLGHKTMLTTLHYLNAQRPAVTPDVIALLSSTPQKEAIQ